MLLDSTYDLDSSTQTLGLLQLITNPKASIEDTLLKKATSFLEKHTESIQNDLHELKAMHHTKDFVTLEKNLSQITNLLNEFGEEIISTENPKLYAFKSVFLKYLKASNELYHLVEAKADHYKLSTGVTRLNRRNRNFKSL